MRDRAYMAVVGLSTLGLLWPVAFRGWIPHDEGTLGQSAVRILDGQWPHIDFLDVYPGLLGVIHAGVFGLLGPSISSLRFAWLGIAVLGAISLFLLLRHRLARRVSALAAIAIILLAFVIYPASMPTWWNVSLGLAAVAMAYAGWENDRPLLVLGAGMLTGTSILIKTTGGAFIAIAIFLWLISMSEHRSRWYGRLITGAGLLCVLALVVPAVSTGRVLLIGLPSLVAVLLLGRSRGGDNRDSRDQGRIRELPWVFAGSVMALPVVVVGVYAIKGSLDALVMGWVSSPALRFASAEADIPLVPSVLLLLLLVVVVDMHFRRKGLNPPTLVVGILGIAVWSNLDWLPFGRFYFAIVAWVALVLAALWWWQRTKTKPITDLVTTAALLFTMIQIPFWNGYYAAYTIPLLGLSLLLLIPRGHLATASVLGATAAVFLLKSMSGLLVGPVAFEEPASIVELTNPRSGISVPIESSYYDALSKQVAAVAGARPIYAGPDAPEVAFLAGVDAATSAQFEVLDPNWDPQVLTELASEGSVVVINDRPDFSEQIPEEVLSDVYAINERQTRIGKFIVTWSEE